MFNKYFNIQKAFSYKSRFFQKHRSYTHCNKETITKLNEYYKHKQFDEIGKLPQIKIIEPRDYLQDKANKRDCIWYVTQKLNIKIEGMFSFSSWQPKDYVHIKEPKPSDVIIYHASQNGNWENHVGIYLSENKVESKFDYGHVYQHPLDFIPSDYGPCFSFYRRSLTHETVATIHNMEEWIKVYGSILFMRFEFPNETRCKKVRDELDKNPFFLIKSYGVASGISYVECKIIAGFLDKEENRYALKQFCFGKAERLIFFDNLSTIFKPG